MKNSSKLWGQCTLLAAMMTLVSGCSRESEQTAADQKLERYVDLERFMGLWYVHGFTPTFLDKNAVNATETYALDDEGMIRTTYTFLKDDANGRSKTYTPVGWVFDKESYAEWRMRFFGLFVAKYFILYVSEDYEYTVVGHPNRKLAWVMSRSERIDEARYASLVEELVRRGYDLSKFRRMLQDW